LKSCNLCGLASPKHRVKEAAASRHRSEPWKRELSPAELCIVGRTLLHPERGAKLRPVLRQSGHRANGAAGSGKERRSDFRASVRLGIVRKVKTGR